MLALVNVILTLPSSSSRSWTRSPSSSTEITVPYIPAAVSTLSFFFSLLIISRRFFSCCCCGGSA